jgi:class 3 adenylate cyclase
MQTLPSIESFDEGVISDNGKSESGNTDSEETMGGVAKHETKRLNFVKALLFIVLLMATSLVSFAVYYITATGEDALFESQFMDHATRLMQEFSLVLLSSLGAIDNYSVTITSHVRSMNLAWPYAFVPEFDIRGASINTLSKGKFIAYSVKVDRDGINGRDEFEEYAQNLSFWVDQALARKYGHPVPGSPVVHNHRYLQDMSVMNSTMGDMNNTMGDMNNTMGDMNMTDGGDMNMTDGGDMDMGDMDHSAPDVGDMTTNFTDTYPDIFPTFFHYHENARMKDFSRDIYYPVFQCEPVAPDLVNYNILSHPLFGDEVEMSMTSRSILVGKMVMPPGPLSIKEHAAKHRGAHSSAILYEEEEEEVVQAPVQAPQAPIADDHGDHAHRRDLEEGSDNDDDVHEHSTHVGHDVNDALEDINASGMFWDTDPYIEFIYAQYPNVGPFSQIVFPIFDDFTGEEEPATGFLLSYVFWLDFLADNLPESVQQVVAVIENGCGQQVSYEINSNRIPTYLGEGDFHDPQFNKFEQSIRIQDIAGGGIQDKSKLTFSGVNLNEDYCPYNIRLYPSEAMKDTYTTSRPVTYTLLVVGTFIITSLTFLGYDFLNEKRNTAVMENARQTNLIVSSLFPAIVRDRLFKEGKGGAGRGLAEGDSKRILATPRNMLKSFIDDGQKDISKTTPIADLFPDTTVMFADIAGFTAWSSLRQPTQVFTLLETIYGEFDALAKKRRVFKVETIGDCYVAVAGLPDPQEDHPIIMARFADSCYKKFVTTLKRLEVTLGPDTTDLSLRLGIHSGPVTAGVLRGEKSRFQQFGDTVNTASRMESTSKPGQIQCSVVTAELMKKAGYSEWLIQRGESIEVKGKGISQTYWVNVGGGRSDSSRDNMISLGSLETVSTQLTKDDPQLLNYAKLPSPVREKLPQNQGLVNWHVEMLSIMLKQIVASRTKKARSNSQRLAKELAAVSSRELMSNSTPLSEVKEFIEMPKFDKRKAKKLVDQGSTELSPKVMSQLRDYVSTLSCLYKDNPFHNFAHASHVAMASNKLLSRVVAPDDVFNSKTTPTKGLALSLHDFTFGLTSDPLTQFAIVFSALIHDVDHRGVSNSQLVQEKTQSSVKYGGKSVAEQHSVDLAWGMLMDPSLEDLRQCIYQDESEYQRFRQLVVNCVIATDIFDKDLKERRNKRWEQAFHHSPEEAKVDPDDDFNRKATIVIEHIIQAADVSHTMQHWHVYQKWNERLFLEMYQGYISGRGGDKDPSLGWYKGELWFFDNYIIPLAKKLEECGVFGVSSAECLNYAVENRQEWAKKGEDIVEGLKRKHCEKS